MALPAQRIEPGERPLLGLADLANRPEPDWQGPTVSIPHLHAEYRDLRRARVSIPRFGGR